ncbi:hypothetical protein [Streptomyces sp. NPDC127084]|uniref:hypothetical protein n=1 Tax=Streptomyces sp. NPDC127084 TaxID=3347133 RepID=UPI0036537FE5
MNRKTLVLPAVVGLLASAFAAWRRTAGGVVGDGAGVAGTAGRFVAGRDAPVAFGPAHFHDPGAWNVFRATFPYKLSRAITGIVSRDVHGEKPREGFAGTGSGPRTLATETVAVRGAERSESRSDTVAAEMPVLAPRQGKQYVAVRPQATGVEEALVSSSDLNPRELARGSA